MASVSKKADEHANFAPFEIRPLRKSRAGAIVLLRLEQGRQLTAPGLRAGQGGNPALAVETDREVIHGCSCEFGQSPLNVGGRAGASRAQGTPAPPRRSRAGSSSAPARSGPGRQRGPLRRME